MGSDNFYHLKKRSQLKRKSKKTKEYRNSILIICEGEKTEPNYFQSFPISNIKVKTIGTGRNTESLVDEAIKKWIEFSKEDEFYERLWCVFDRDRFSQNSYDSAFKKVNDEEKRLNRRYKRKAGRKINISIAYSNEAFELWYLLHFDYIDSALSRSEYKRMLTETYAGVKKAIADIRYGLGTHCLRPRSLSNKIYPFFNLAKISFSPALFK